MIRFVLSKTCVYSLVLAVVGIDGFLGLSCPSLFRPVSIGCSHRWKDSVIPLAMTTAIPDEDAATTMSMTTTSPFQVAIEYCPGCRWGIRSFWMAQELLSYFQEDAAFSAMTLVPVRPPLPAGSFYVKSYPLTTTLDTDGGNNDAPVTMTVLWNRKEQGGFPEIADLKERIIDMIASGPKQRRDQVPLAISPDRLRGVSTPGIAVTYSTEMGGMLRATYVLTEIMSTFNEQVNSFSFIPNRINTTEDIFTIALDGVVIWDYQDKGAYPPMPELKQTIRDRIDPTKNLGHSDVKIEISLPNVISSTNSKTQVEDDDTDDDEDTLQARMFFGVA